MEATVTEAASAMTEAGQSWALIQCGEHIGIVTDSDFRARLASGTLTAHTAVAALASFPAVTVGADTPIGDGYLRIVEGGDPPTGRHGGR